MTAEEMKDFIDLISNGLGANGERHPQIAAFNKAVRKMVVKGTQIPEKVEAVLAAGRKVLKTRQFRLLAAGAVISGLLSEVIAEQGDVLEVAAKSGHYRRAMQALQAGDLARAQNLLTEGDDSLYTEILAQVGAHAALSFKSAMERMFSDAHSGRLIKDIVE